jgi:hypothetical protein
MADNDDVSETPEDAAAPVDDTRPVLPPDTTEDAAAPAAQPVLKTRWRDRAWSFRALLAVALATLVLGGVAGGAIVAASDDDHDGPGRFMMGPGGPGNRLPPGFRGHRRFDDGAPKWRWDEGPEQAPNVTPFGEPSPPTPSPTE